MFGLGEGDDGGGVGGQALGLVAGEGRALEEFVDGDAAGKAGGGVGGEAVGGAGDVVTGGDGGMGANEDGAGVYEGFEGLVGVAELEVDVFGGELVGVGDQFALVVGEEDGG